MTHCYVANSGFYNGEGREQSQNWPFWPVERIEAAGPDQAQIGGPQIIGTATIPLNYSILVRPLPPHTVLMDILIGFGHIVLILRFKFQSMKLKKIFREEWNPANGE